MKNSDQFFKQLLLLSLLLFLTKGFPQAVPDTLFQVDIVAPYHKDNALPIILIDEMHNNLHKADGNFAPFAQLARKDGYITRGLKTWDDLEKADILVIANAIHERNIGNWERPISTAFSDTEIAKIKAFVSDGGSLLLIADHMPFAGAVYNLADAFGFEFCDGFAQVIVKERNQDVFSIGNKGLTESIVINGTIGKKVDNIVSFMGSSFTIPNEATGVLKFREGDHCLKPEIAWQFNEDTEKLNLEGSYQGAIMEFGNGKIAVFGEAAMFTAQSVTQNGNTYKIGFNSFFAPQNLEFVRNVLLWLSKDVNASKIKMSVEKQILNVNRDMEMTFNNKDFSGVANFYADEAVIVGCNPNDAIGIENIKNYWNNFSGDLTWKLENIEIKELGDGFALQRGYSNVYYIKNDGSEGNSKSIFSLVWQKTSKGWKIMLDHFAGRQN